MAYDLISCDDHIIEHATVWTDRLPAKYREAGPHVVEEGDREFWAYEGERNETMGLNAVAGREREDFSTDPVRFSDMIPGCYDPAARVKDMDLDGVRASIGFPSFPRFAGVRFLDGKDKDLSDLCVKAWNDFILDEWCPTAPDRFIPLVIGQLWDPELMAAEIRRCADKGARTLSFTENPTRLGLPSIHTDHWDPVWQALTDTGLVACMHIGTGGQMPQTSPDAPTAVAIALAGTLAHYSCIELLFSRVPREFPDVKWIFSEGGIGWVPYALERADYTWERHKYWNRLEGTERPSEVFQRCVWVAFIDDLVGVETRHHIGVDKIVWECDYPHSDSSWPHSQKRVAELLEGVPSDEVELMTHQNAERLFGFGSA